MEKKNVFLGFAPEDEAIKEKLSRHLFALKEEGFINQLDVTKILPGSDVKEGLNQFLEDAHIIILLLSADFIASDECHEVEKKAFELKDKKNTILVPIIARPCLYNSEYHQLKILPDGGKAITNKKYWNSEDDAFLNIAQGIKYLVTNLDSENIDWEKPKEPSKWKKFIFKNSLLVISAIYLIAALIIIPMLLQPQKGLLAEINLELSHVGFKFIKSENPIANDEKLLKARVYDFSKMNAPANLLAIASYDEETDEINGWIPQITNGQLKINPSNSKETGHKMIFQACKLDKLFIDKNALINLSLPTNDQKALRINIKRSPASKVSFSFQDSLQFETSDCILDGDNFKLTENLIEGKMFASPPDFNPVKLDFAAGTNSLSMDLLFQDSVDIDTRADLILVDSLRFFTENQILKSSVLSGNIIFKSKDALGENDFAIQLQESEYLGFRPTEHLQLTRLKINNEAIQLQLDGQLDAIKSGNVVKHLQNRMPSKIAWLWLNNKMAVILYGLAILGLTILLFRFSKRKRQQLQ